MPINGRPSLSLPPGILQTNKVPDARTLTRIRTIIGHKEAQIETLLEERARACAIVAALDKKIENIRKDIKEHQALTTPARRLPLEILFEIFHHCKASWPLAPPVLASVCSRWRAAALSESSLWQSLSLTKQWPAHPVEFVDAWLQRSKSKPLHLSFNFSQVYTLNNIDDAQYSVESVWQLVVENIHRVKSLDVIVSDTHLADLMERLGEAEGAPLLQNFNLEIPGPPGCFSSKAPITKSLPPAPRLEIVRLTGASITWDALKPSLPSLRRLTLMDVRGHPPCSMDACLDVINLCPDLEYLRMPLNILHDRIQNRDRPVIRRPSLKELILECYAPIDPGPILDYVNLPNLRSLSMSILGGMSISVNSWPHLSEFVTRSRCPLEDLSISGILVQNDHIQHTLKSLSSLQGLTLRFSSIDDDVLAALTYCSRIHDTDPSLLLCPKLRRIELEHCHKFSGDALVKMIRSRTDKLFVPGKRTAAAAAAPKRYQWINNRLEAITDINATYPRPSNMNYLHVDFCSPIRANHCTQINTLCAASTAKGFGFNSKLCFYESGERYEMAR
ncbi:hypothetical protein SISNIDRAFT_483899 [Sistotremastrum niveocremeum HHB9708]|uniref:F-box domain-containing protein n=2 Tax=Sistotremastraceae TaxID=3402574 RepID=A0A164X6G6_9AGAM|nr:hypothetical protein SISNIDRAFT_483899 [Sistotremastrum niveocremeum HHB9708]KZT35665.1 hypothetical protein SISSUDRAFT_1035416 [Sistotremastrum suecicum HHB10207 ss-3]